MISEVLCRELFRAGGLHVLDAVVVEASEPFASQGKRIWILRTQVSGRKVDSGGIGQLLVAEIHAFEGNVRANNTVRSQIQTASGFFCSSDVKEIPNAFALLC
jgi:non-ribosomal peptide synthetase component E (peptide arylation enzyme)